MIIGGGRMKLKLNEFTKSTRKLVLFRGIHYYQQGRATLDKQSDKTYYYDVAGQENNYKVVVNLGEENMIVFSSCDCPYSAAGFCKHQVASFIDIMQQQGTLDFETLENAEVLEEKTPEQPVPEGWSHADFQRLKNFDVSGYLATFSRDELIFIMLNYMQIDMKLFMYIFHHYMVEEARSKIRNVN
jgi:hypothetical protein